MREVFLVGLNHKYQLGLDALIRVDASPQDFAEFADFLRSMIERHRIRGIAEEMSLCALKKHFVRADSFPCRLAAELGLPHRYCDPDIDTQKDLKISEDSQREQYWIKELVTFDTFPVLFILGADHVDSFKDLLIGFTFQPFVIARNWEPGKPQ